MSLKEKILTLREEGQSYNEIANKLACSKATISYHCKRANLNNIGLSKDKTTNELVLKIHELEENGFGNLEISKKLNLGITTVRKYCSIKIKRKRNFTKSECVSNWRQRMKIKAVDYKGGECIVCGYKKSMRSLSFHHLNPNNKEFSLASGNTRSWEKMKKELDKCVLVCSNCHAEIHDELIKL